MTRKGTTASKFRSSGRKSTTPQTIPDALRYFDSLPHSANVRQPVVEALFGYSSATVWRRSKDGGLPRPRKLSPGVTAWNVGELRDALHIKRSQKAA